jgi:hypothetical protein
MRAYARIYNFFIHKTQTQGLNETDQGSLSLKKMSHSYIRHTIGLRTDGSNFKLNIFIFILKQIRPAI